MNLAMQETGKTAMLEAYPLSPIQQGMLYHALQEDHAGVDIEQILCALPEDLAAPAFKQAWEKVAHRHDILRSSFRWEDVDAPVQTPQEQVLLPWIEHDWRAISPAEQETKLNRLLQADRQTDFDLAVAPLMRFNLVRFGPREYRFLWTFHHALLDGRSFPIVLKEVFALYEAALRVESIELPAPRPFRDHIAWLGQKDFEPSRSYWKTALRGFSHPTAFGIDRSGSRAGEEDGGRRYGEQQIRFSAAETSALRRLAEEQGVTMNTLLQAAWALLLSRHSGEEDVVFGATRACRATALPGAEAMVGIFINTLPVRTVVDPERPLSPWLKELRSAWMAMREHEHTPLATVQSWSDVAPGLPLFESIVVFENFLLDSTLRSLGGAWVHRALKYFGQTNFPITVMGYLDRELLIIIGHNRRRFTDDAAQRILGHLRTLLLGMAENPNGRLGDLPMLTDTERGELMKDWTQSVNHPAERCIHELVEAEVRRRPEAVAVVCDQDALSYGELDRRANQLAHYLRDRGVGPESLVALCLERSVEMIVAILGVLKAGGAYLPLDLAYPPDRLAFMLEDARASVLLTQETLLERVPVIAGLQVVNLDMDRADIAAESDTRPDSGVLPHNLAYVIYTSGSTGKPKGVLVSHANVARLFHATESWFHFNERDVWTLFHSYAFDFSVWEIWGALIYGGKLVVVPYLISRSPEAFYELLCAEQVTVLNQTPSAFHQLIHAASGSESDLALRYVIFGGEALELQSLRPWFEHYGDLRPRLVNMYGITETTVHVTYRPLSRADLDGAPGSVIGVPIPDLELYILDRKGDPVPLGVAGEIYVGGAGVARGYLRRDALTTERFIAHPFKPGSDARLYRTGDLGRFLPGRDLEYLGRADDQVKIRGFRIELGEIESVLCQHPNVDKAVVIARQDSSGVKRLAAYLVAAQGGSVSVSHLRDFLKNKLPEYMVPAAFVWLERLPLTPNGKADRRALPEPELERPDLGTSYVAPRTPAEQTLARIWSEVLRVERVGIEDNFFELGGDSILSIQIVARAGRAGLKLKPHQLFKHPKIVELAALAGVALDAFPEAGPVSGEAPLTPIQHWFFEQRLEEPQHYNQAFLFQVMERLDRACLEGALKELARHHDALRLRYARAAEGWRQRYSAPEESAPLTWMNLAQLPEAEQRLAVETASASAQASLNLESGPLWRVVYFDLGTDRPGRLLIAVHHLAIDGVSWRPLLEDLETVLRQLQTGRAVRLPLRTTSGQAWAQRLCEFARSGPLRSELVHWRAATAAPRPGGIPTHQRDGAENTEATVRTVTVSLSAAETSALLQQAPAAYNTQINDMLLTALARAWQRGSGSRVLLTNLEGHGREDLFDDVDLTRTVGWFTSIFPARLELPGGGEEWQPGEALKSIKEQLRRIPRRGIGYGILRYLCADTDLASQPEPEVLFNYLGQFDQVLAGSRLFRFAGESGGPWHSPKQRRRHALEINSLVVNGQLELRWAFSERCHGVETIERVAGDFLDALRQLIAHCLSPQAGGCTPSDFPLARLDQPALDGLAARVRDIEDVYPLSPMQTLFFTAGGGAGQQAFDQWHCTLRGGGLDVPTFQRAWEETVRRQTVLRSTIHAEGLREPVQVVHRQARLPWSIEDWRANAPERHAELWAALMKQDRARPLPLTEAPAMRFALARTADDAWKFLWSVPALLLDGWSWPLVFRDVSRLYEAFSEGRAPQMETPRPYRDYLEWHSRQRPDEAQKFWSKALGGFVEPNLFPGETPETDPAGERYAQCQVPVSARTTGALQTTARRLQLTLSTLVQGAWAILVGRQSGRGDVVFGAAFSGRPTDLPGVESIVGPFVNSLPVRIAVRGELTVRDLLRQVQARLLQMSPFQFTPLMEIQRCSEVPWRHRLFDSLLVFQNYLVDDSARRLGHRIELADFAGPIHTSYPVTLLAEPGQTLRLTLIYDRQSVARAAVARWARDLADLFERLSESLDERVADLQALLSKPVAAAARRKERFRVQSQNFVPPQTEMERAIAGVWQQMFGREEIGIEDSFFDLGGHSMLLVQVHSRLRETLRSEFPIVTLFQYPTIRSLAAHLGAPGSAEPTGRRLRERAQRQKEALAQMRTALRRQ